MYDSVKSKIEDLRTEIPYIAKEIVNRQLKLQPEFEKYGPRGMQKSLDDAKYNLEYLFSAIETDSKLLLEHYNRWTNRILANLKLPANTLENFYYYTKEVFKEKFYNGLIDEKLFLKLTEYIDIGIEALKSEEYEAISYFKLDNPYKELLQKYSSFIFSSDKNSAVNLIKDASDSGIEIKDIYKYILQPFQLELGNLWHDNQISVAQEHYATAISQFAMSLLYERIFSTPKNEKVFLGTCVQGELHEFGIRMVCDYMENCGWNTYYLGANMTDNGIIQMINEKKPDIIAISCTMTFNISKAKNLVQAIKDFNRHAPVIVGGYPFNLDKYLWKKVGADAYSGDFEEAFLISEKLVIGGK